MANKTFASLDEILHALADPTRRKVVELLRQGPSRVTDLAGSFDLALSSFSRHIKVLEAAGVIRRERDGREHRMALIPEALSVLMAWASDDGRAVPLAEARVLVRARELAASLADRMAAVELALAGAERLAFSPTAYMARRLLARLATDPAFRLELADAHMRYQRLLGEIEQGRPSLDTVIAVGSLTYTWASEPAFRELRVLG